MNAKELGTNVNDTINVLKNKTQYFNVFFKNIEKGNILDVIKYSLKHLEYDELNNLVKDIEKTKEKVKDIQKKKIENEIQSLRDKLKNLE